MARFARIDSQVRANRLILANRLGVPELNAFFANRASGAKKLRIAVLRRFARIMCTVTSLDFYDSLIGRHLVGIWIGGVWNGHFPESEKYFSEAEFCRKIPVIPQKERFLPNFRLRNLKFRARKIAIPYSQPFHTPTRLPAI